MKRTQIFTSFNAFKAGVLVMGVLLWCGVEKIAAAPADENATNEEAPNKDCRSR